MHERYFENTFPSYETFESEWHLHHPDDTPLSVDSLLSHFEPILEQGIRHGLEELDRAKSQNLLPSKDDSIYSGVSGIALMYLKLAIVSETSREREIHLTHCREFLEPIVKRIEDEDLSSEYHHSKRLSPITFLCGQPGIYAVFLHYDRIQRQHDPIKYHDFNSLIQRFLKKLHTSTSYFSQLALHDPSVEDELLYGRAGYLYSLLYMYNYTKIPIDRDLVKSLIDRILLDGERLANQERHLSISSSTTQIPPLCYRWHGRDYCGAAHGLAGIFSVLLMADQIMISTPVSYHEDDRYQLASSQHSSSSSLLDQVQRDLIYRSIKTLEDLKFPETGNFPSHYLDPKKDTLVQFCHGAPGLILLFTMAYEYFNDISFLMTAKDSAEKSVWTRGLLTKGSGLCHGISGNAYAFLALYRVTRDLKYLYQALSFTSFLITKKNLIDSRRPIPYDSPFSLCDGLAGDIYLYAELLHLRRSSSIDIASSTSSFSEIFPAFPGFELSRSRTFFVGELGLTI